MKRKLFIIFILFFSLIVVGCDKKNISKEIEIDNANCKTKDVKDNHGGFLGDGSYYAKVVCDNLDEKQLSKNWKKLPLSKQLNDIMNMEICDDDGCLNAYNMYKIPIIDNGYYYFYDRHSMADDRYDDKSLNSRSSYNFSLAIYDIDNNVIYYYKLDT